MSQVWFQWTKDAVTDAWLGRGSALQKQTTDGLMTDRAIFPIHCPSLISLLVLGSADKTAEAYDRSARVTIILSLQGLLLSSVQLLHHCLMIWGPVSEFLDVVWKKVIIAFSLYGVRVILSSPWEMQMQCFLQTSVQSQTYINQQNNI